MSRCAGCCRSSPRLACCGEWTDPLDDTVAAEREITVRDLLTFTFGFGMHIEMFTRGYAVADHGGRERGTARHDRPTGSGDRSRRRRVDQAARVVAADGAAGRALALQHRRPGARRAVSTRRRCAAVCRRPAVSPSGTPRACRRPAFFAPDMARLATAYANTPDGLTVWDRAGRQVVAAAGVRRRCGRAGLDGGRPARVRADVPARRYAVLSRESVSADDARPADPCPASRAGGVPG